MGAEYVEPPAFDLSSVFADSGPAVPILFLLTPGADPGDALARFARCRGMGARCHSVSLGRGLGAAAADEVRRAMRAGDWVYLQNCHLAGSWMPLLEGLVGTMQTAVANRDAAVAASFRLWLSAAPSSVLPAAVVQTALKICVEPPVGIRSTLLNTFCNLIGPTAMILPVTSSPATTHTGTITTITYARALSLCKHTYLRF
jgi:dynein heavy chain